MAEPKEIVSEGFYEWRSPSVPMGCYKCGNDIFNIETLEDQQQGQKPIYLRIKCAVCKELIGHLTTDNVAWGNVGEGTKND